MGSKVMLSAMLLMFVFVVCGCGFHGQGETAREGRRRHKRQATLESQMLADDLDAIFYTDRPTRLSELNLR